MCFTHATPHVCNRCPPCLQIVVVAGSANITLWDSYSGTFLGILGSFGQLLDIPGEINPSEGIPLDPLSGRATCCPAGTLPPLGTEFVDMIPPEDTTLGSKVNTAANVATSVASTFAKKCGPLRQHLCFNACVMLRNLIAGPINY